MYELKKIGNVFTSKFVGTGPSSYKKRIYRAAVSQRLRNTGVVDADVLKHVGVLTVYRILRMYIYIYIYILSIYWFWIINCTRWTER